MQAGKNPEPRKKYKKINSFNYQIEEYIYLPSTVKQKDGNFFNVLKKRKSDRDFKKISLARISQLLWNAARVKEISLSDYGTILSHRAAPSAGGIHPIDIFISLPASIADRKLYYYEPFNHKLGLLKVDIANLKSFFRNINGCLKTDDATIVWLAAHFDRTAIKYKNPESLVWRDAGALIMTVQLVSAALNIKSCPIGTLGEPFLSKSFGTKLISAGGLLIG